MDEPAAPSTPRRGRWWIARYTLGITLGVIVLLILFGQRGEMVRALNQLGNLDVGWSIAATAVEILSIVAYAYLQRVVLALSGAEMSMSMLSALSMANIAISYTVPGEPAVSSAYRYRVYRRRGASGAGAAWAILTILVAQAIGMTLLLFVGALLALSNGSGTRDVGALAVGLVVVVGAGTVLLRQDLLLRLIGRALVGVLRFSGHPRGDVAARIQSTLQRMRDIPVPARTTMKIVAIATAVWFIDFVCMLCCFEAVHAAIPWHGVLLAFGVAQVVAAVPFVPGGIGLVEGSLAVILVAYGAQRVPALAVVLAYRLLTFWFAVIAGWLSVGVIEWRWRRRALS